MNYVERECSAYALAHRDSGAFWWSYHELLVAHAFAPIIFTRLYVLMYLFVYANIHLDFPLAHFDMFETREDYSIV